jgi:hypothetical protein
MTESRVDNQDIISYLDNLGEEIKIVYKGQLRTAADEEANDLLLQVQVFIVSSDQWIDLGLPFQVSKGRFEHEAVSKTTPKMWPRDLPDKLFKSESFQCFG